jgi:hypothetical protein
MREKQQGGEQLLQQLFLGYTLSIGVWAKFMICNSTGNFSMIFCEFEVN